MCGIDFFNISVRLQFGFEKILDSVWNELDLVKKCGYGIVEFDIPLDTL